MPGLESNVWAPLHDQGLRALVIHVGPGTRYATQSRRDAALATPMLLDVDRRVDTRWTQTALGHPPYPLGYILDREGVIRYVHSSNEPAEDDLKQWIQALLDE